MNPPHAWSGEQVNFLQAVTGSSESLFLHATAGSGKTSILTEAARLLEDLAHLSGAATWTNAPSGQVTYFAYNSHTAREADASLEILRAVTFHAHDLRSLQTLTRGPLRRASRMNALYDTTTTSQITFDPNKAERLAEKLLTQATGTTPEHALALARAFTLIRETRPSDVTNAGQEWFGATLTVITSATELPFNAQSGELVGETFDPLNPCLRRPTD